MAAIFAAVFYWGGWGRIGDYGGKEGIGEVLDFELSPDEGWVAFTARRFKGGSDLWTVGIDGKNLKRLTFSEYSIMNKVARFFEKRRWRGFLGISLHHPKWTTTGRIGFCQEISNYHIWGVGTVSEKYFTIKPDGTDKRPETDSDKYYRILPLFESMQTPQPMYSQKFKRKIFLKEHVLWVLDDGETTPKQLIP